jgi:hypothetical protein
MKSKLQKELRGNAIKSVARAAAMFLAVGIAVTPSVFAKPKVKKAVSSNLGVIAHVQLDGGAATRMLLVQKNEREYLYVGFGSTSGFCIFDVTTPTAPRKLGRFSEVSGAQAAEFQQLGDALAVMSPSGADATNSSDVTPRSVTILNTTDPANPRQIQTFSGVTSVVGDDARGQIYLSNSEGLWVVQTKLPPPPAPVEYPYGD